MTLVGVPGIGKSRLVWELLQTVEADPELVTWRHGRCLPYGEGVALWALGEIVKAQAGILESDPADVAEAKLARTVIGLLGDPTEAASGPPSDCSPSAPGPRAAPSSSGRSPSSARSGRAAT